MNIGIMIKQKRESLHITQQALAESVCVDRSTVAKWETGEAMPRVDKLPEIAKILNCDINDLFVAKK